MNEESKFNLLFCLALAGCIAPGVGPDPETDDTNEDVPDIGTSEQALVGFPQVAVNDNRAFGGNIFAETFPYPVGRPCLQGYVRSGTPTTQWTSANGSGFCFFNGWVVPTNPHDCTANIVAHTGGGFYGGTCYSTVLEEQNTFTFSAANTGSAQFNTRNQSIALNAGQTLTIGTCGVLDSSFSGDTYLRLFKPDGTLAGQSDDQCSGLGSRIVLTAQVTGIFEIRAGCYSSTGCSGTVAWLKQ